MRWWATLLVVTACGGGLPALPDASEQDASADVVDAHVKDVASEPDVPFSPAAHPGFPHDGTGNGIVLTYPHVVPVFFKNDSLQPGVEAFLNALAASSYWTQLRNEYGVGALTVASSVVLNDTPPTTATSDDVASFIASKLNANDPAWLAASEQNIYFVYYPAGTTLTLDGSVGCTDFGGYHSQGQTTTTRFVFAAMPRCPNVAVNDAMTETTSHELVEATTDPYFDAFSSIDWPHAIWSYYPGAELGDLCEIETLSYQRLIGNANVARFWSNTAAAAGHDPCAPAITAPYYNSIPVLADKFNVTLYGSIVSTSGVSVPTNQTRTIDVKLFSDAPTSSWSVNAEDSSAIFGGSPELTFSWDTTSGNNGDTLHLTIKRLKEGAMGGTEFAIYSQHSGDDWHVYFAVAGN